MPDSLPTPWHIIHTTDLAADVVRPRRPSAVVYSLPHSGRYYPDSFMAQARQKGLALRTSEDAWVDEMVGLSPDLGVYGVACRYARAFCDVNRSALELDARLIRGDLPRATLSLSARVKAGFGVIARRLGPDQDIYTSALDMAEVNRRLDLIHTPYHEALRGLLAEAGRVARPVVLIDWHSMPSSALHSYGGARPDIVLGNRHGESCGDGLVRRVRSVLEGAGLRVGLNKPFAGGYIVETYGRPMGGGTAIAVEALQVEINRAIYMDEGTLEPHDGLQRLKAVFSDLTMILTR